MKTYYSIREVADRWGVSRQRVDQLVQAGRIPYEWIGEVRAIHRDNLKRPPKRTGHEAPVEPLPEA